MVNTYIIQLRKVFNEQIHHSDKADLSCAKKSFHLLTEAHLSSKPPSPRK